MRSIAIDLGDDSIKLVELVQNKKNVFVNSVFEKKLSAGVSEHDREIEAIEFVRNVLSQSDFSGARFIMAIRQDKATIRTKTFPFADRIKIQKSLSFEMEEDIPFDPDLCVFDFKVIRSVANTTEILAVAVPKSHIEKCLSLAKDFGIELHTLTVEGLAFANLLEAWYEAPPIIKESAVRLTEDFSEDEKPKQDIQIILNFGHKKTLLCAMSEGRLVFIRSLMWGADSILQELLRKYQLPYIEAQRLLQARASLFLTKQGQDFEALNLASTIEKSLRDLVRDIQMSFLELKSEYNGEIQTVSMTGGLSLLPNLGAFLTQHLEVACNPVTLVANYMRPETSTGGLSNDSIQSRFSTTIAMGLEAFKKPRNPALQFMKGEFVSDNNIIKAFWQDWGSVAQVALAALIVLFTWGTFRESFTSVLAERGDEALKAQAKNVARLPKKQANEKGVKRYITENKKRAQEMKLLTQIASMNSALDVLKSVSEKAPSKEQVKIDIVQFNVKDDHVQLAGYANSPKEVDTLTQRLSTLSTNNKVNSEKTTLAAQPNRVAFSLSFTTDRGLLK